MASGVVLDGKVLEGEVRLATAKHALDSLNAARAEYNPDIVGFARNIHRNGSPLLPGDTEVVGFRAEFTVSGFGKHIGLVKERQAQLFDAGKDRVVAQAERERTLGRQ